MPVLAPADWVRAANELQRSSGKPLPREYIENRIGKPSGRVTRKTSEAKGGKWGTRTGDRSGQTSRRNTNIKDATGPQTEEDKRKVRNIKSRRSRLRRQGVDADVLHPQGRPSLVGPQVRDAEQRGVSGDSVRGQLRRAGYPLGDDPEGLSIGSGEDNRAEEHGWQRVQRKLGEMEDKNPSPNNHPNLIQLGMQALSSPTVTKTLQNTVNGLAMAGGVAASTFKTLLTIGGM